MKINPKSHFCLKREHTKTCIMYNEEIIVCDISETYYKQPERLLDIDKLYVGAIISFGVFKPHIYNIYIIDDIMNGNGD